MQLKLTGYTKHPDMIKFFINHEINKMKGKEKKILEYFEVLNAFSLRKKKQRIGRNPKTKETKIISERNVILFKASKEFKDFINNDA